jgi:hypothetical protein
MDAAKSVSANFVQIYELSVTPPANGTIYSDIGGIVCGAAGVACTTGEASGTAIKLTAVPADGYRFSRWDGCSTPNGATCTVNLNSSTSAISAVFEARSWALSVTTLGQGSVSAHANGTECDPICLENISNGSTVTLTAQPATGYAFKEWSGDCRGTATACELPSISAGKTATATFIPVLTVTATGPGLITSSVGNINCDNSCSAAIDAGTAVTLTAVASDGYRFMGWTNCEGPTTGNTCELARFSTPTTVGAIFEEISLTLTVIRSGEGQISSTPEGIDCGSRCVASFSTRALNSTKSFVKLEAVAKEGYAFGGWSGCSSVIGTFCYVKLSSPQTAIANFTLVTGGSTPVNGKCGTADGANLIAEPTVPKELCLNGLASPVGALKDGRFSWTCLGLGDTAAVARCYTSNSKQNQTPLLLRPGAMTTAAGRVQTVTQTLTGGSGTGGLRLKRITTAGTICKIARVGKKLKIKIGGTPGTCTISVVKAKSGKFNEIESPPIIFSVR